MSFGDLTRISTNVQAMQALGSLQNTNAELGLRQLRLSTGSQINRAEDDSAGFAIAKKLEARVRGQAQALANIGDAKSMLTVGEGSLNSVMEILQTMKEKTVQAANDTLGTAERGYIEDQLHALSAEVQDIIDGTTFNGRDLFAATAASRTFDFQVGASNATADRFTVTMGTVAIGAATGALSIATGQLVVGSSASARATLENIDDAIDTISSRLAGIGDDQSRLTFKQDNLSEAMTNYEAARSRIIDADFAKEQMEIVKLQILQQTGTAALAQSNASPQGVLSLF